MKNKWKMIGSIALLVTIIPTLMSCGKSADKTAPMPESYNGIEAYSRMDMINRNLTAFDFSEHKDLFMSLAITNKMTFPSEECMPDGVSADDLLAWGEEPGLNMQVLYDNNYIANNQNIAFISQPVRTSHNFFQNAKIEYQDTVTTDGGEDSLAGCIQLSVLCGEKSGMAKGANIFYVENASWEDDQINHANAIKYVCELNKSLPDREKISMLAIPGIPLEERPGYNAYCKAIKEAQDAGIWVWLQESPITLLDAMYLPMTDRNDPSNVVASPYAEDSDLNNDTYLAVPTGGITTAYTTNNIEDEVCFNPLGMSGEATVSILGLAATAHEINPGLTQQEICIMLMQSAFKENGLNVVNPVGFIAKVLESAGNEEQAKALLKEAGIKDITNEVNEAELFHTFEENPNMENAQTLSSEEQESFSMANQPGMENFTVAPMPEGLDGLDPYAYGFIDEIDLSSYDFSNHADLLNTISFTNYTKMPDATQLPKDYVAEEVLEWGKYAGLHTNLLKEYGYTGKGAVIAYVDQPLNPEHDAFTNASIHYCDTVTGDMSDNSMHGPAVLSLLCGEEIGTAPDAAVYYVENAAWEENQQTSADAIHYILDLNATLPEDEKITMIGFSDCLDANLTNEKLLWDAITEAEEQGVFVFMCDYPYMLYGADYLTLSDKDDPANLICSPLLNIAGILEAGGGKALAVPSGGRTVAYSLGEHKDEYCYWADGGMSWATPYVCGLCATAHTINPDLTQEEMFGIFFETAYEENGLTIINPVGFMAEVLQSAGRDKDAQELMDALSK